MRMLAAALAAAGVLALAPNLPAQGTPPAVEVRYYFSPECSSCARFIDGEVPRVQKMLGIRIDLALRDIRLPGVLEELDALLAAHGLTLTVLPVAAVGDDLLVGSREISRRFDQAVRRQLAGP